MHMSVLYSMHVICVHHVNNLWLSKDQTEMTLFMAIKITTKIFIAQNSKQKIASSIKKGASSISPGYRYGGAKLIVQQTRHWPYLFAHHFFLGL